MTFGNIKELVAMKLKGDNADAVVSTSLLLEAIKDIARRCEPKPLIDFLDDTKTDIFRVVSPIIDEYDEEIHLYIKLPTIEDSDTYVLPLEEELSSAVIYFLCEYLTRKEKLKGYYKNEAENIILIYRTNKVENFE
ncbi:MAG: hypothetical protein U9N42_04975 [Campylobacterota bacterium]|nr:hypothetical protein [Campylobacterota bacterium]